MPTCPRGKDFPIQDARPSKLQEQLKSKFDKDAKRRKEIIYHRTSTSPLFHASFTPSHRTAQTSPLLMREPDISLRGAPGSSTGTMMFTSSSKQRTNTTSFVSGAWTIFMPPALSSRRRSWAGKEERKEA